MEIIQTSSLSLSLTFFFSFSFFADSDGFARWLGSLLHLLLLSRINLSGRVKGNLDSEAVRQICWIYAHSASQNTMIASNTKQNHKNDCFEMLKPTEQCGITPQWPHCKTHSQNMSVYHRGKRQILLLSHMTCQPRAQWAMRFDKIPLGDRSFTLILHSFHLFYSAVIIN